MEDTETAAKQTKTKADVRADVFVSFYLQVCQQLTAARTN